MQQNQISDQAKKLYHIYFSHYFSKIKIDSYPSLPIKKTLTLHDIAIDIKSALNKNENQYYYKKFLERRSFNIARN